MSSLSFIFILGPRSWLLFHHLIAIKSNNEWNLHLQIGKCTHTGTRSSVFDSHRCNDDCFRQICHRKKKMLSCILKYLHRTGPIAGHLCVPTKRMNYQKEILQNSQHSFVHRWLHYYHSDGVLMKELLWISNWASTKISYCTRISGRFPVLAFVQFNSIICEVFAVLKTIKLIIFLSECCVCPINYYYYHIEVLFIFFFFITRIHSGCLTARLRVYMTEKIVVQQSDSFSVS